MTPSGTYPPASGGETGTVTSVPRFGGALNLHVHFHTLVLDGVYVRQADGTLDDGCGG